MREFFVLITIFAVLAWFVVLFFGSIIGIQKSFSSSPQVDRRKLQYLEQEVDRRTSSARERQRLQMQEYKQKIRDNHR